jgi:hypothetical protein
MHRILFTPSDESRNRMSMRQGIPLIEPYTTITKDGFETYNEAKEYLVTNCYGNNPPIEVQLEYVIEYYDPEGKNKPWKVMPKSPSSGILES